MHRGGGCFFVDTVYMWGLSAMCCAKIAEPIEMQFVLSWNMYYIGCRCPREGTLLGVSGWLQSIV